MRYHLTRDTKEIEPCDQCELGAFFWFSNCCWYLEKQYEGFGRNVNALPLITARMSRDGIEMYHPYLLHFNILSNKIENNLLKNKPLFIEI